MLFRSHLRGCAEAQIVALYLLSNPHANMIGFYYLPKMFITHETGLSHEGASKGLQRCIDGGFCKYDGASEVVWICEMARFQIAEYLKPEDKRCVGIQSDYLKLPNNPFLPEFHDRYVTTFHLTIRREYSSPSEAPSKPRAGAGAGAGARAGARAKTSASKG